MLKTILIIGLMVHVGWAQDGNAEATNFRGSFENITTTVLDLKTAVKKGYKFTSVQIEFEKEKIWVSGMLPIGDDVKIGSEISLMVQMNEMPTMKPGKTDKVLSFMIMPGSALKREDKQDKPNF